MQFHVRFIHDETGQSPRTDHGEARLQYLDQFSEHFDALGTTCTDDGERVLSRVAFVEFEDWPDVLSFVENEPLNKVGIYKKVQIRRWHNGLKQRQSDVMRQDQPVAWYIRGHGKPGLHEKRESLLPEHLEYLREFDASNFVVRGPIWDDTGVEWQGSAMLIVLASRSSVEDFIVGEPYYRNGLYANVEIERYYRDDR